MSTAERGAGFDEDLHPLQIEALRRMSFEQKWALSLSLLKTARSIRRSAIAASHPDWTAPQVDAQLASEYARSRT